MARSVSPIILFLLPALILYSIFEVFPILYSIFISFFKWHIAGDLTFVGLGNYQKMFSDPVFIIALKNTFIYTIVTVPTQ
ncbi:MAG: sugar ABC transporter permease, partial [Staphylothermus sp.]|nr:sugar ABC transporter permease [Staphylothermus sp.]